jgi:peroxiredoxin
MSTGWQAYMSGESGTPLREGERLPCPEAGTLQVIRSSDDTATPDSVACADLFRGKRVVLVGMPGAFTPVCTGKHLPGYLQHRDELKAAGVDDVLVCAVNDAFVMRAWGKSLGCLGRIALVADANLALTRALGLTIDLSDKGLGVRSKRYAAIVDDGVLSRLFVEPQSNSLETAGVEHVLQVLREMGPRGTGGAAAKKQAQVGTGGLQSQAQGAK